MSGQLRIYRVREGAMDEWIREWRDVIVPLRAKYGFRVAGSWTIPSERKFVWIAAHDDFERAHEKYYNAPERAALDPDPTRHLEEVAVWMIEQVAW